MAAELNMNDTYTMAMAVERMYKPGNLLVKTFFPNRLPTSATKHVQMEYRIGTRRLAPFVSSTGNGVSIRRNGSFLRSYVPPIVGPKRVISEHDIDGRDFGKTVYTASTPEEQAVALRARDLSELMDTILRRQNWMAAQILTTGKCVCKGLTDVGGLETIDTIDFTGGEHGWTQKITPSTHWDKPGATIYDDIKNASEKIQEEAGAVPQIAIVGKNIETDILNNEQIMKYLSIPNNSNLSLMSMQPKIVDANTVRIGYIQRLNLEIYSYREKYYDDETDTTVPYVGDDDFIIGIQGRGKQLFGAINLVEEGGKWTTYAFPFVPRYNASIESNTTSLTMYSRMMVCPEFVTDWAVIKTRG